MEASDKKERILQVATALFSEYGVRNTSVEQIAKGAKVGKGTLYLYFADKEALFGEVLHLKWEAMSRRAESSMQPGRPFMEKLLHLLAEVTATRAGDPFFAKIHTELTLLQTPEIDRALKRVQLEATALVEKLVQEGIAANEIPAELPSQMLAFLLVKAYSAFIYEWPKEYPAYSAEELAKVVTVLLSGKSCN